MPGLRQTACERGRAQVCCGLRKVRPHEEGGIGQTPRARGCLVQKGDVARCWPRQGSRVLPELGQEPPRDRSKGEGPLRKRLHEATSFWERR